MGTFSHSAPLACFSVLAMSAEQGQPIASTSTASIPGAGDEKQIAIRLSTKDPLYTIPPAKFLVPASWRRFHLSELINKVLDNASPIPFDFLIDQTLLRSSLGAYCQATGTSEEVVLEVEFLPSTLPPQLESTLPSEDWVSDVSVAVRGCVACVPCGSRGSASFVAPNLQSTLAHAHSKK